MLINLTGLDTDFLKKSCQKIVEKYGDMGLNMVDPKCEEIFKFFTSVKPRIDNYFYMINKQIDWYDAKEKGLEIESEIDINIGRTKLEPYKGILAKVPKYVLKDIVRKKLVI